jgi:hypothetical protein
VVDLADSKSELRQPGALGKKLRELELHSSQLAFGRADFVGALRWRDDTGDIFRVLAERLHVARQAQDRLHDEPVEGQINETGGEQRDQQRKAEHVAAAVPHHGAQGSFVHDDLDQIVWILSYPAEHADVAVCRREEDAEGIAEQTELGNQVWNEAFRRLAQVVVGVDFHVVVDRQDKPALAVVTGGDRFDLRRAQQFAADRGWNRAAGEPFGGQRCELGCRQPLFQPIQAKACQCRHKDQGFGHHHEGCRQQQQACRQAKA